MKRVVWDSTKVRERLELKGVPTCYFLCEVEGEVICQDFAGSERYSPQNFICTYMMYRKG